MYVVYLFSFPPVGPLAFVQLKQSLSSVSINVLWKWTCSPLTFGCEVRVPPAVQVELHQESAVGRQITATTHCDAHRRVQYFSSAFQPATKVTEIFFPPQEAQMEMLFTASCLLENKHAVQIWSISAPGRSLPVRLPWFIQDVWDITVKTPWKKLKKSWIIP